MELTAPAWTPPGAAIPTGEDAESEDVSGRQYWNGSFEHGPNEYETLEAFFKQVDISKLPKIQASEFEKDDDSNFHLDFITSCTNMRAWNYRIDRCDRNKARAVAGKLTPALATTTALVEGLVGIEFYKLMLGKQWADPSVFRDCDINLAAPVMCSVVETSDPIFRTDRVEVRVHHKDEMLQFAGDLLPQDFGFGEQQCFETATGLTEEEGATLQDIQACLTNRLTLQDIHGGKKAQSSVAFTTPSSSLLIALASKLKFENVGYIADFMKSQVEMATAGGDVDEKTDEGVIQVQQVPQVTYPSVRMRIYKAYPNFNGHTFCSWDSVEVDEGAMTIQEFADWMKNNLGLDCQTLEAYNRTPLKGQGNAIYQRSRYDKQIRSKERILENQMLTERQRRTHEKKLASLRKKAQKGGGGADMDLIAKYTDVYGELLPNRSYVRLTGKFVDLQGCDAEIPTITYIFPSETCCS